MAKLKNSKQTTTSRNLFSILKAGVLWLFPDKDQYAKMLPAFGWAALSAILLRLAYWPLDWSFVLLFALVPLFWGLRRLKPNAALYVGWLFGTIYSYFFLAFLHSTAQWNPLAHVGVPVLALWFGFHHAVALSLIVFFGRRLPPGLALLFGALTWAAMEYFRSIGAFAVTYAFLGQGTLGWSSISQLASIGGIPLISALFVALNLALMETIASVKAGYGQVGAASRAITAIALIIAGHFYGASAIQSIQEKYQGTETTKIRLAILQPNVPQELKLASYADPDPRRRATLSHEMAINLLQQMDEIERGEVDLILTPESSLTVQAFPLDEALQTEIFRRAADQNTSIIVGSADFGFRDSRGRPTSNLDEAFDEQGQSYPGMDVYNALWIFRPQESFQKVNADYRKVRLMPFGETIPYFHIIPGFAEVIVQIGSFTPGSPVTSIEFPVDNEAETARFGPTICYEDLFPNLHRRMARGGAQFFLNITNNGWFDPSPGSRWHLEKSRWRTIESRLPMVRCTNTGVSAIIGPTGEILEELPVQEKLVHKTTLTVLESPSRTLYTRFGDWFGILALLSCLGTWVLLIRMEFFSRKSSGENQDSLPR